MNRFYQVISSALILCFFVLAGVVFLLGEDDSLPYNVSEVEDVSNEEPKLKRVIKEQTVDPAFISALVDGSQQSEKPDVAFYENLPGSLIGAPKPAALEEDQDGNLVVDQRVKRVIEFYLMAMGEEPIENIIARIEYEFKSQLGDTAYHQGMALLENYLQYRNNIGVIKNQYADRVAVSGSTDMSLIKEIKQAVRDSRSDYFSEEVIAAFYSKEDQYDDYMISKVEILQDSSLSEEMKSQQLEMLNQNTSFEVVQSYSEANQLSEVRTKIKAMRAEGLSEDDVNLYREQQLGQEVAERLKALDEERKVWQTRLDDYRLELKHLQAGSYSDVEKSRLIEELRAQHFDEREILRVRVLDGV
ncbi:lipase secretion chaperone [Litoribrevibacter albus]|uniref:Lipase chaperone n=1 Tax=Litoribrevibacter albus TaxID=1473156 RepID=A0AA37S920_9GAMM|nr:lipase secretion chaperone [Litoribrevibacter albus]GLQ30379.1 hypothetical protein GCM10007876_08570 [Litoribrevibacter albus]